MRLRPTRRAAMFPLKKRNRQGPKKTPRFAMENGSEKVPDQSDESRASGQCGSANRAHPVRAGRNPAPFRNAQFPGRADLALASFSRQAISLRLR
ncbi:MAG: hypothetical protein JOZ14_10840 [Acidobacteria bacterium]|nr:hypothetical protein [Acidobacteriota bacterium]